MLTFLSQLSSFFASYAFYGFLDEKIGPRYTSIIGLTLYALGTLLFSFSNSKTFDAFFPAALLLGAAGPSAFLESLHICQLYKNSKIATTIYIGLLCGSALVFLLFARLILEGVSHQLIFFIHFTLVVGAIVSFFVLQPDVSFTPSIDICFHVGSFHKYSVISREKDAIDDANTHAVGDVNQDWTWDGKLQIDVGREERAIITSGEEKEIMYMPANSNSNVSSGLEKLQISAFSNDQEHETADVSNKFPIATFVSVWDAIRSYEFIHLTIYANATLLRFNFYLATSLTRIDANDGGTLYSSILFLFLPLLGASSVFTLVAPTMNRFGINGVMWVAQILGSIYGLLVVIPGKLPLLTVFILLSIHRGFFFSFSYPYISTVFGIQLYGQLNGILMTSTGITSLLQYPLIEFVESSMDGEYFYLDIFIFCILGFLLFFSTTFMSRYVRSAEAIETEHVLANS